MQKAKINVKLNKGKKRMFENDYRGALNIYREILSLDNTHPKANYKVSECQYNLGKYTTAMKYVAKAYSLDSTVDDEIHFLLGSCYHKTGKIDLAKKHYLLFKKDASSTIQKNYFVDNLISQCDYAKKQMENPIDVTIKNIGKNINTINPEYSASVTADGKTLVFTSRRSDTKGGMTDSESDNLYFEDIYISKYNDIREEWGKAEPIKGKVNTESHDAVLNIAPDGSYILVYKSETKAGDIYISKYDIDSNRFSRPKPIDKGKNVNSSYFEGSASMTSDGNTIFFVSDRSKGKGGADVYMSLRVSNNTWSEPVNLGDSINTELDEQCVFVHPKGQILFFTSQGHDNLGGYDIFVSYKKDGRWGKAKNLGYPINTVKDEKTFSITQDGKTAFISAQYKNSKGGNDIYQVDLSKLNILEK